MSATITIYTTTFLESEVFGEDGESYNDIPYDDDHTTETIHTYDPKWDDVPRVEWVVDTIIDKGLVSPSSSGPGVVGSEHVWYSDPDGSTITNYGTGEREECSAHLSGLTPTEYRYIYNTIAAYVRRGYTR
jgi:hypothetical protein